MSCPIFPHEWTEGDQLPELIGVLEDIDLTNLTVTLDIERPTTTLTKTAAILEAAQGKFKFSWDDTDLVAGVGQVATLFVEDASNRMTTIAKFIINVLKDPTP
jgi:hypothetical protein